MAPQFCENSLELADLGELDYSLAGTGSYETAFFLPPVVDSAAFHRNQRFPGEGSVTKEFRQHRSVPLVIPLVDLAVQQPGVAGSVWLLHRYLSVGVKQLSMTVV